MSKCTAICDVSYLDYAANKFFSSEKAAYPASNVYDLQQRTKVWRTAGFFRIVSGENSIVFREQAGVDITATVTAGTYASQALFCAEIKAALELVGVGTYTVEITTTGKIKITQSVGGGATVFQLMTTDAAFADMAEIMGFGTDANFTGADNYTADVLRIHSEEFLLWDLGVPTNPKAFILAGDRNLPLKLTPGAVVTLEGNWTNDFDSPAVSISVPLDDFVLAKWSLVDGLAGAGSPGYRYWRAKIVDRENTRQFIEFGVAYLGSAYVTERGCAVFPLEYGAIDPSEVIVAEAGQTFGYELPVTQGLRLQWNALNKAEEQELRHFFERQKKVRAFFMILDSVEQSDGTGAFSVNNKEWVKLLKFADAQTWRLSDPNWFEGQWQLREEL